MAIIVEIGDNYTVIIDLKNVSFKSVKDLALLAIKKFRLEGFIIESSPNHYLVVFDKPMGCWSKVLKVISWMGIIANNRNSWKWVCMQAIKGYCT